MDFYLESHVKRELHADKAICMLHTSVCGAASISRALIKSSSFKT